MKLDQYLAQKGTPVSINPGQYLFRQGEKQTHFHYLSRGLLKAIYLTSEGKESVKTFFSNGTLVGSLQCIVERITLPFGAVALQESQLLRFSLEDLREQAQTDLELAIELIDRLIQVALKKEKREREFLTLSPYERYCSLRDQSPEILESVTQADIALYLGVTPVALSRMKSTRRKRVKP